MFTIKDIIRDIFLVEFYERKFQEVFLINQEQAKKHTNYFIGEEISDIVWFQSGWLPVLQEMLLDIEQISIEGYIQYRYPIIFECLRLCNGKLSICGTLDEIAVEEHEEDVVIHLYFHSITIIEAQELLIRCLNNFNDNKYFINNKGIIICCEKYKVIFHTSICKSIQELLLNRGHIIERQLWNPLNGYVTTLATSMAIALSAYVIDITIPCINLMLYNEIGIGTIFYGLNNIQDFTYKHDGRNEELCEIYKEHKLELPDCILYFSDEQFIIKGKDNNPYPVNLLDSNINFNDNKHSNSIEEIVRECGLTKYKPIPRIKFDLQQYFGINYIVSIVGIDNDKYAILANCVRFYRLPKELLELLCSYWLKEEMILARDRLLSLHN